MRFAAIIRGNEREDEPGAETLGDEGLKTCLVCPSVRLGIENPVVQFSRKEPGT